MAHAAAASLPLTVHSSTTSKINFNNTFSQTAKTTATLSDGSRAVHDMSMLCNWPTLIDDLRVACDAQLNGTQWLRNICFSHLY